MKNMIHVPMWMNMNPENNMLKASLKRQYIV